MLDARDDGALLSPGLLGSFRRTIGTKYELRVTRKRTCAKRMRPKPRVQPREQHAAA